MRTSARIQTGFNEVERVKTLSARQTILLVAIFIGTSIGFIALDNRQALDPVKTGVHDLINPITEMLSNANNDSGDETELQRKYDELQAKYDALTAEYTKLVVTAREIDQLRAMLNLQNTNPNFTIVPARVSRSDPTNTQKFIIIDKGSADGIKVGMAVTDPNYYVGLVAVVDEHQSRVALAIDASQSVGVELLSSGAVGIAWGMWQRGGRIEVRHIPIGTAVVEGEYIVTACETEAKTANVPCRLVIGIVSGPPVQDNQGDTQVIPVSPAVDFDNLSVVAVIVADSSDGT
jgi:rod shape-determining protein MreC